MDAIDAPFTASGANGMARAVVDGGGRLLELHLDPDLLLQPAVAVERAAFDAVTEAQHRALTHRDEAGTTARDALARQVAADVERAGDTAERGLAELSMLVSDLLGAGSR